MNSLPPTRLPGAARFSKASGSAIVVTLAVIVILTILAIGTFSTLAPERISANSNLESVRARSFAQLAADHAISLIRDATTKGSPPNFWASQPGCITVFNADGTVNSAVALCSGSAAGPNDPNTVELNQPGFDGTYPIASPQSVTSGSAPSMKVQWINVLQNPAASASATNQVIGRYAFWVDDECAKIDINTADGTGREANTLATFLTGTGTYGSGTPTEVDLQALVTSSSGPLTAANAENIATQTGAHYSPTASARPFNSASEIGQFGDPDLYPYNNFDLTEYNRSPELNIFGEPKIYLVTTGSAGTIATPFNGMLGPYKYSSSSDYPTNIAVISGTNLTQVYPASSQLPSASYSLQPGAEGRTSNEQMPQYFTYEAGMASTIYTDSTKLPDYQLGMRIANYLYGLNSQGQSITWPAYPGNGDPGTQGFRGKYTPRQIDSITLQILDLMERTTFADQFKCGSIPTILKNGLISGKLVKGLSDAPHINQIVMTFTTTLTSSTTGPCFSSSSGNIVAGGTTYNSIANLSVETKIQWYLPKEYKNLYNYAPPYDNDITQWDYGMNTNCGTLNCQDMPLTNGVTSFGAAAALTNSDGSPNHWGGVLLNVTDQNGLPAGIDFFGNTTASPDPDQSRAALYHPWTIKGTVGSTGTFYGAGPATSATTCLPMLGVDSFCKTGWTAGDYHCTDTQSSSYPTKPGVTSLNISGGIAIWEHPASCGATGAVIDPVPLDSLHGQPLGENPNTATVRSQILNAVIPVTSIVGPSGTTGSITVPVPGSVTVVMTAKDPLVNGFPGDWTISKPLTNGAYNGSTITLQSSIYTNPTIYQGSPTKGETAGFTAAAGGDPGGYWLPVQNTQLPKSQRLPSAGFLQYIHTGLMPDYANDPDYNTGLKSTILTRKGTPFRLLNFSASTDPSQKTAGGTSYPDWAMLDLFTVPAAFQTADPTTPIFQLTWGGATTGRINPNSAVEPFGATLSRTRPLEAVLNRLYYSNSYRRVSRISKTGIWTNRTA